MVPSPNGSYQKQLNDWLLAFCMHIQDWSNDSPLMLHRQHHPNGNKQMEAMMAMFFHLPNK